MNRYCFALAVGVLAAAGTASAAIVSSSPHATGGGRAYLMDGAPARFHDSFFDIFVEIDIDTMSGPAHTPGTGFHGCPDDLCIRAWENGAAPPPRALYLLDLTFEDAFVSTSPDGTTNTYDIEMLTLSMDLIAPIVNPGIPAYRIRESTTLRSLGRYTVETLASGEYRIDSFFDVFLEISFDDFQTWIPSDGPVRLSLVPAPSSAFLLAIGGIACIRRRRV